jgi:hypothetical protein
MSKQAILDKWYAAIKAGDAKAIAEAATPDVSVVWNGQKDVLPFAGRYEGAAAVAGFFQQIGKMFDVRIVDVLETIEAPDTLVTKIRGRWLNRMTHVDLMANAVNIFRFRDGKVASYEVFNDTAGFAQLINTLKR